MRENGIEENIKLVKTENWIHGWLKSVWGGRKEVEKLIVIFPKLSNGNILWSCKYCNRKYEVTTHTRRVWLMCSCGKESPECNKKYYCNGEYFEKQMFNM